jgi:hypothetical protein
MKTTEEKGVGVHSLACNTLGVRRASWSYGMVIRTSDKWVNYSHGPVQTKQQVSESIVGTFLVHK